MSEKPCSEYITWEDDFGPYRPCNCPVCGGFLKWDSITDEPKCNKCHTPLIAIPDQDEETGEFLEWGKICTLSPMKDSETVVDEERSEK